MFTQHLRTVVVVLASLGMTLQTARPTLAQRREDLTKTSAKVAAAFRDVVAGPSTSTVNVLGDGKDVALGTVVAADGWIVTKASELKGKTSVKLKDGTEYNAKIIGVHEKCDLALLKIDAKGLTPIKWAEAATATPGDWVAAPGKGNDPVAVGVVSVAARKVTMRDMPLPSKAGYLGVALESADGGAKVTQVMPKSAAAKAELKADDIVLSVDNRRVLDHEAMIDAIQHYKPGDTVTLHVKRGEKEIELKATLDKRPTDERSDFQNKLGSSLSDRRSGFPAILQTDTILKPNECGGPLVNLEGKAVGINIARAGRVETYALPSDVVKALIPDMKDGKFAVKETVSTPENDEFRKATAAVKKAEDLLDAAKKKLDAAETHLADVKKSEDRKKISSAEEKVTDAQDKVLEARKLLTEAQKLLNKVNKK